MTSDGTHKLCESGRFKSDSIKPVLSRKRASGGERLPRPLGVVTQAIVARLAVQRGCR